MNKFKLAEIMSIGNAIEQAQKALEASEAEGNDHCSEDLGVAIAALERALKYAESCIRGED